MRTLMMIVAETDEAALVKLEELKQTYANAPELGKSAQKAQIKADAFAMLKVGNPPLHTRSFSVPSAGKDAAILFVWIESED